MLRKSQVDKTRIWAEVDRSKRINHNRKPWNDTAVQAHMILVNPIHPSMSALEKIAHQNLWHFNGTYASSSSRVCCVSVPASTAVDMYRRESDLPNLLSATMLEARDVLAPRAVLVKDDDDDDGTKASAVIAVESRKRSAALVVFIAAVFSLVSK